MIDRKSFENGSNPSREREEALLRGVSGWLEPSEPWLARRNGISSAVQEPAYGKCRLKDDTCKTRTRTRMWGEGDGR
jgi:hypothetical protein